MRNNIKELILKEADYIIKYKTNIRETSKIFKISKSTLHKDITERLIKIDKERYKKVRGILDNHINNRHILGGLSTKLKYNKILQNDIQNNN